MGVSPCIAWCSADARPSPRHTSPWSCRSATGAQRLVSAGTLVRVLEPPVKAGISQGRSAQQYPPLRCGAADSLSSIAKPVVSWDHHNLLISTIHEGVTVLGGMSPGAAQRPSPMVIAPPPVPGLTPSGAARRSSPYLGTSQQPSPAPHGPALVGRAQHTARPGHGGSGPEAGTCLALQPARAPGGSVPRPVRLEGDHGVRGS